MTTTIEPLTLEEIKTLAIKAKREWLQSFVNTDKIAERVKEKLETEFYKIIYKFLQSEDHSRGNSYYAVNRHVKEAVAETTQKWLTDNKDSLPQLKPDDVIELKNMYLGEYKNEMRNALFEAAKENARRDAEALLTEATS